MRERGLSLIEMVVAMVLVAIIVAATIYFANPVRQAADITVRADLTDAADNALQRVVRDVRLALPNSVRAVAGCGTLCIEFIPVRTAGRYRTDPSGAGCNQTTDLTGSDELAFDVNDGCFKSIGTLPNASSIVANPLAVAGNDFLVLNNYGSGFSGQDAYATSAPQNRAQLIQADEQGGVRERINYVTPVSFASTFSRTLHDSPGRRFFIVTTPLTYECNLGNRTLRRWTGYAYGAAYTTGTSALIANDVTVCGFDYVNNVVNQQIGLLTVRLTLSRALTTEQTETVTLYQSIHVNNTP